MTSITTTADTERRKTQRFAAEAQITERRTLFQFEKATHFWMAFIVDPPPLIHGEIPGALRLERRDQHRRFKLRLDM